MWDSCFSSRWQLWIFAGFQNHSNACISASDTRKNITSCSCSDPSNISSVIEANIAAEIVHRCFKLWSILLMQTEPDRSLCQSAASEEAFRTSTSCSCSLQYLQMRTKVYLIKCSSGFSPTGCSPASQASEHDHSPSSTETGTLPVPNDRWHKHRFYKEQARWRLSLRRPISSHCPARKARCRWRL